MRTYCVNCKKDTENIDSKNGQNKNNRLVMQSKTNFLDDKNKLFG